MIGKKFNWKIDKRKTNKNIKTMIKVNIKIKLYFKRWNKKNKNKILKI
jgi:hypothetical protein